MEHNPFPEESERAATLLSDMIEARTRVSEANMRATAKVVAGSKESFGRAGLALEVVRTVLDDILARFNGREHPYSDKSEQLNTLSASFYMGLGINEAAIAQGCYLQASALLRQEMETLAQMEHVVAGRRKPNGAPKVTVLEDWLGRIYGDLTKAAHVSDHRTVSSITQYLPGGFGPETSGTRYFPLLQADTARKLLAVHIMLLIMLMQIMVRESEFNDILQPAHTAALDYASELMIAEGLMERDPDA